MSPVYVFLAFVVAMIVGTMLLLYLLAYIAGRREERRAREDADAAEQPNDAQPSPSP